MMFDPGKVKGILFDYGGTIDSNGMHWAEVIWMGYQAYTIPVDKETFRDAYVHGERALGKNPIIKPEHTFGDMLRIKMEIQFEWLHENGFLPKDSKSNEKSKNIADWCYAYAKHSVDKAKPIITQLANRYPLVLVSNFYGNVETVLKDFQLDHLFRSVVESAVVGVRKPDPKIFSMGVEEIGLLAEETVVVGDSHDKDIIPAQSIGCQTIWIKGLPWKPYKGDETADAIIEDFQEMAELFRL